MSAAEFRNHQDLQLYICDHVDVTDKKGRGHCDTFNAHLLEISGPHFNCADECWKFWPARGWQSTSEADVFYNAQHRHFGDDNLFLTQRHNDIDSIIVDRCQETVEMKHLGKLAFMLGIRQPDIFISVTYQGRPMPSKEGVKSKPFRLDVKGLAQCYDTSADVGILGRASADIGSRKKGLPFWIIFPISLLLIAAVIMGVKSGTHFLKTAFMPKKPAVHPVASHDAGIKPAVLPFVASQTSRSNEMQSINADEVQQIPLQQVRTNELKCTGWVKIGNEYCAFLSDGTEYSSADHELDWIQKRRISILGKTYDIQIGHAYSDYISQPQDNGDFPAASPPAPVNQIDVVRIGAPPPAPLRSSTCNPEFPHGKCRCDCRYAIAFKKKRSTKIGTSVEVPDRHLKASPDCLKILRQY